MVRKARREGMPDSHFLEIGAKPPTAADLLLVGALQAEDERIPWWRERFGQHCYSHHMGAHGCERDRACAFLHAELGAENKEAEDPSWLQESGTHGVAGQGRIPD